MRDALGRDGSEIGDVAINDLRSRIVKDMATEVAGVQGAKVVRETLSAVNTLMRVRRLQVLYSYLHLRLSVDPPEVHKPLPGEERKITVRAAFGVRDEDWATEDIRTLEEKQLVDCLRTSGLPAPYNLEDLADELADARIEWRVVKGAGTHVVIATPDNAFAQPGQLQVGVGRVSGHEASGQLVLRVLPEKIHEGEEFSNQVTVEATLETSQLPGLWTFVNGAKGGTKLLGSAVELLSGWAEETFAFTGRVVFPVIEHRPARKLRLLATVSSEAAIEEGWFASEGQESNSVRVEGELTERADGNFGGDLEMRWQHSGSVTTPFGSSAASSIGSVPVAVTAVVQDQAPTTAELLQRGEAYLESLLSGNSLTEAPGQASVTVTFVQSGPPVVESGEGMPLYVEIVWNDATQHPVEFAGGLVGESSVSWVFNKEGATIVAENTDIDVRKSIRLTVLSPDQG
jgi:hypothetical protein